MTALSIQNENYGKRHMYVYVLICKKKCTSKLNDYVIENRKKKSVHELDDCTWNRSGMFLLNVE
jgi:hypothetical protein